MAKGDAAIEKSHSLHISVTLDTTTDFRRVLAQPNWRTDRSPSLLSTAGAEGYRWFDRSSASIFERI